MHTLLTQLAELPPTEIGEIYDYELHTRKLPAPRLSHAMGHFSSIISEYLYAHNGQLSSWWLLNKPEIRIGKNIVVPDVAAWQKSSLPSLPETYFETPCNWATEFIRNNQSDESRNRRLEIFAELGVSHLWLVDTRNRMISCCSNQNKRWVLLKEVRDEPVRSMTPFEDEKFDLTSVWNSEVRY